MKRPTYFDPEHVDRPVPPRPWRALAIVAVLVTVILTAGWEIYWRGKMFVAADYKNTNALWAEQRRKAVDEATVIIGSSRIFFDIDLDVWEEASGGVRPVQLALEGTSPRIFLGNLANDEKFHGLVIVGVTAPLFFTQDGGLRAEVLKYIKDESPSQRVDHFLSKSLDRYFAFVDDQTRPKTQMTIAPLPLRDGMKPRFYPRKLETLKADRNTELWARVADDEGYRKEAQGQWEIGFELFAPPPGPDGNPLPMPDEAINAVIAEVKANVDKIRAKGGDVAFMRLPYDGGFMPIEDFGFPRARFWDRLLAVTDSAGVAFQDYPELQGYYVPEWSHLEAREAERYTRTVAPIFYARLAEKKAARAERQ
ncbi:MAG: hypothetical protein WD076_05265 [Parvularculaceae bacterium]